MRKRDELTDPNSCMNRAKDDEWTFVLLEHDVAAPDTIRDWCARRVRMGKNLPNDPQIREAQRCANAMEIAMQDRHAGTKLPQASDNSERDRAGLSVGGA